MLKIILPIVALSVILVGCNKSGSEETDIVKNPSNDEKTVSTKEDGSRFEFVELGSSRVVEEPASVVHGSSRVVKDTLFIAGLSNRTDMRIQAETERTKKRLSESSAVFWSLSGLVNDEEPSYFVGGKATPTIPDYIRSYFQEAGFNGEPDLVRLIKAYKNGDRKVADLVERLVHYSAQQADMIGEINLLAFSRLRGKTIIMKKNTGEWLKMDTKTVLETVPFADILFEDYLRTISDGLYSRRNDYGPKEFEYIEKQYDEVLETLKAMSLTYQQ